MISLVPIVEGKGEVEAVPVLLRRLFDSLGVYDVGISRPFRVKRNQVVREGEIERAVRLAVADRSQAGGVLVILDSDDDCPARLGPGLLKRCRDVMPPSIPVAVVLARREFEAWFLGAKESLRGARGIRKEASNPDDPEGIRGAKEHLTRNMQGSRYLAVDDQPAFAELMDLKMARGKCPSFDKLVRDLETLLDRMKGAPSR